MIARNILIEGEVQGVFFRERTVERAREFGVTGWVRNRRDGRVEVYAAGDEAQVASFIDGLRSGSPASRVNGMQVDVAELEPLESFTRRQTV